MPANSQTELKEVEFPKSPSYRVGVTDVPELQYVQAQQSSEAIEQIKTKAENQSFVDMTYADLSIKRLSKEIAQELQYEEKDMVSDLSLLWQGAAVQSDTINFALYKLANPDADKPDEKSIKNVLKTIASMSTLVGAGIGSPVIAGASLIGGNILGIMSQDTKALNYKYTKVNDADMIILIRKVEDLQQKAVDLYYDYMGAKKQLEFANELVTDRQNKFHLAQTNNAPRELVVITDAYYRTALDKQRNAKAEFYSKRAALEQFVGNETFVQFEAELIAREKGEPRPERKQEQTDTANNTTPDSEQQVEQPVQQVEQKQVQQVEQQPVQQAELKQEQNQEQEKEYNTTVENITNYTQETRTSIPKLREAYELNYDTDVTTGFAAEASTEDTAETETKIEDETTQINEKKRTKKQKKIKAKKEKKKATDKASDKQAEKVIPPEKKYPKNSTKNLIFLHGADKSTVKSPIKDKMREVVDGILPVESQTTPAAAQQNTKPAINTYGFMPLDEIRVPDLHKGGYSIHSEYTGDTNNGEIRTFQY